ncbi:hypothetical protein HPB52_024790 [Rhipicephalus sanguineus]|uniref:Uncharacterized protein n=1 Tax=Rhipicephalus sanguineus TaxID=34632 RepID=A0A9D4TDX1_RHISA|nr:hypothetical protein HPB52_024790 [Rhipicephalus sanguineus]
MLHAGVPFRLQGNQKDKLQRGKGKRAIPQQESGDFNFESKYTGVCANHFDASDIVTTHDFNINGDYVSLKRDKPTLKADAVPRILKDFLRISRSVNLDLAHRQCDHHANDHGQLDALDDAYEQYRRAIESRGEVTEGLRPNRGPGKLTANLFAVSGIVRTAAEVKKNGRATTGGGPEDVAPLDDLEARVANTLDPEAVFGVSGGLDIGAPTPVFVFIGQRSVPATQILNKTVQMLNTGPQRINFSLKFNNIDSRFFHPQ